MKKLLLMLCLPVVACSPRMPENEFHIEGHITDLRDSAIIDIGRMEGNMGQRIASDTVIDGRFSFVLPTTEKSQLYIMGRGDEFPSMFRHIYAAPSEKATVTGEGALYVTWNIKSRIPEQHEMDAYISQSHDEYIRNQQLSVEQNKAYATFDRTVIDSLQALQFESTMAIMRGDIAVMDRTPVSDIWIDKLRGIAGMVGAYEDYAAEFKDNAMRLYESLSPEQKELPVAQTIKFDLFPPEVVGVGDPMADATLKAFDGEMHTLSDYTGKGQYLILDFWGSGCGPCIMSMPELKALGEKYPETLKVIGINTDTTEEGWKYGTENFKPSYLNLNAPPSSDIDERYGVNGIPHFVIVSPEGVILDSWSGYGAGIFELKLTPYIDKL